MADADDRAPLPALLNGLTERERECLRLRYAMRLPHKAISDVLGLSFAEVSRTVAVAMRKVARAIEDNHQRSIEGTSHGFRS